MFILNTPGGIIQGLAPPFERLLGKSQKPRFRRNIQIKFGESNLKSFLLTQHPFTTGGNLPPVPSAAFAPSASTPSHILLPLGCRGIFQKTLRYMQSWQVVSDGENPDAESFNPANLQFIFFKIPIQSNHPLFFIASRRTRCGLLTLCTGPHGG